ncbi:MAG: hypothetical protein ACJAQT_003701 [Akkermansiaceae bacterium]
MGKKRCSFLERIPLLHPGVLCAIQFLSFSLILAARSLALEPPAFSPFGGSVTAATRLASALQVATLSLEQDFSQLLITEIMYHPTSKVDIPTPRNEEFIEFKNLGDTPLDLSGMRIISLRNFHEFYSFPEGSLAPAGGFVVLVANVESFLSLYPGVPYDGVLPPGQLRASPFINQWDRIALIGPDGSIATHMRYESHAPWPVVPDNHNYFEHLPSPVGFSLTRTTMDPMADPEHFSTWRASFAPLGSPGSDDLEPDIPPLVVNEIRFRSTGEFVDAVEIYNPTSADVPIGGWWLSDKRNSPYKYKFPAHLIVPGKGYLVVDEVDFSEAGSDLAFNSRNERCYLFSGDSNGELSGYSHGFEFSSKERNASFGRVKSADGQDYFFAQESPSLGSKNSRSIPPAFVITEIMDHPEGGGFQYFELHNPTRNPLPLWDPEFPDDPWSLGIAGEGIYIYPFPVNITVPPKGYLVCVAEAAIPFDVPEDVQIATFPDFLFSDALGSLSLYRPSGKIGNDSRFIVVEQTSF